MAYRDQLDQQIYVYMHIHDYFTRYHRIVHLSWFVKQIMTMHINFVICIFLRQLYWPIHVYCFVWSCYNNIHVLAIDNYIDYMITNQETTCMSSIYVCTSLYHFKCGLNSLQMIFVMKLMQWRLEDSYWWTVANIDYELLVYHWYFYPGRFTNRSRWAIIGNMECGTIINLTHRKGKSIMDQQKPIEDVSGCWSNRSFLLVHQHFSVGECFGPIDIFYWFLWVQYFTIPIRPIDTNIHQ